MLLSPFQALLPNTDKIKKKSAKKFDWDAVKVKFNEYDAAGFYVPAPSLGVYLYEIITSDNRKLWGLVANVDFDEMRNGKVKPHEQTLTIEIDKQKALMLQRGNAIKPLLLVHKAHQAVKLALLRAKANLPQSYSARMPNDETHTVYYITDPVRVEDILKVYERYIPALYIADGHHRAAATLGLADEKVENGPHGLFSVIMADDQITIHDYSRWVSSLNGMTAEDFLEAISLFCYVEPLETPDKPDFAFGMTMFLKGKWYSLFWRPSFLIQQAQSESDVLLATQLLNDFVLGPLLGITDVRKDRRLQYIDGMKGTNGITDMAIAEPDGVGFCLHPIEIEDVYKAADQGVSLPPKSTWFEPRIKNGFIVEKW